MAGSGVSGKGREEPRLPQILCSLCMVVVDEMDLGELELLFPGSLGELELLFPGSLGELDLLFPGSLKVSVAQRMCCQVFLLMHILGEGAVITSVVVFLFLTLLISFPPSLGFQQYDYLWICRSEIAW